MVPGVSLVWLIVVICVAWLAIACFAYTLFAVASRADRLSDLARWGDERRSTAWTRAVADESAVAAAIAELLASGGTPHTPPPHTPPPLSNCPCLWLATGARSWPQNPQAARRAASGQVAPGPADPHALLPLSAAWASSSAACACSALIEL